MDECVKLIEFGELSFLSNLCNAFVTEELSG